MNARLASYLVSVLILLAIAFLGWCLGQLLMLVLP
jgi:hypothetical protein